MRVGGSWVWWWDWCRGDVWGGGVAGGRACLVRGVGGGGGAAGLAWWGAAGVAGGGGTGRGMMSKGDRRIEGESKDTGEDAEGDNANAAPEEVVDGFGNKIKVNKQLSEAEKKKEIKLLEKKLKEGKKKGTLTQEEERWVVERAPAVEQEASVVADENDAGGAATAPLLPGDGDAPAPGADAAAASAGRGGGAAQPREGVIASRMWARMGRAVERAASSEEGTASDADGGWSEAEAPGLEPQSLPRAVSS